MADETIAVLETPAVCRLVGMAPTTLDYWVRTGLVTPSARNSAGRRVPRLWTVQDVLIVRCIKALREAGCPLQKVRDVKSVLEERWGEGLRDYVLFWDGGDVVGIDRWGNLQSLVRKPSQQLLHVVAIPIEQWRKDAEADARHLPVAQVERRRSSGNRTPTRRLA
jgi:DNA-binding transcriptional MerR regulator